MGRTTPGPGLLTKVYKFLVYLLNLSLGQDLNSWVCVRARARVHAPVWICHWFSLPLFSTFHCCLLIGYWGWWQSLASWGCRGTGANSYNSDLNFHNRGEDHIYDKGRTGKPKPFTLLHSEAKGASDWKWLKSLLFVVFHHVTLALY